MTQIPNETLQKMYEFFEEKGAMQKVIKKEMKKKEAEAKEG